MPVDSLELSRLILEGQNRSYDSLPSRVSDLHFSILEKALQEKIGIQKLTPDLLITLGLIEPLSSTNIGQKIDFSKNKVLNLLNELIQKGYVVKIGNGRGTRYRRSK